jgi:hypothetical protein
MPNLCIGWKELEMRFLKGFGLLTKVVTSKLLLNDGKGDLAEQGWKRHFIFVQY